jgi:integral membrane protein (TIGR01906 family)
MKNKSTATNIGDNIIVIAFSLVLFIIIIFGSLNMMIFNKDFYYKEYAKNNIYKDLPENIDTTNVTSDIITYFRGGATSETRFMQLPYFSEDEKSHMIDVKHLIRTMQIIYYSAAILSMALFYYCYRRFKDDKFAFIKTLSKSLLYSSIASIVFLVLIFLMSVFSFESVFIMFHQIFFPQGNWTFASTSLLITLFPKQFFFDISLRIFIYAMFQALIFFGMGYWIRRQLKIIEKHRLR